MIGVKKKGKKSGEKLQSYLWYEINWTNVPPFLLFSRRSTLTPAIWCVYICVVVLQQLIKLFLGFIRYMENVRALKKNWMTCELNNVEGIVFLILDASGGHPKLRTTRVWWVAVDYIKIWLLPPKTLIKTHLYRFSIAFLILSFICKIKRNGEYFN